jgi:hypothetical protein
MAYGPLFKKDGQEATQWSRGLDFFTKVKKENAP